MQITSKCFKNNDTMNCEQLDIKETEPYLIETEIKKHAIANSSITALYER